jgi:uncharacterized membrane protein YbhN (UPF0104 family)
VRYHVALQAEMVSMLAKYLPGGVWTPAARALALRRYGGVTDTPTVLASILVEAGLSAISGVIVFVVSLAWVRDVNAPLLPLVAFALLLTTALHPRIFRPLSNKLLKPFGAHNIEPLPFPLMLGLLLFYCGTWLIGGFAVYFMLRALGAEVGLATIPFLGGVSAVGAIVSVLAVFVPSGLGAREASMYGLLLAVTDKAAALGVTIVNRLAITLIEVLLFGRSTRTSTSSRSCWWTPMPPGWGSGCRHRSTPSARIARPQRHLRRASASCSPRSRTTSSSAQCSSTARAATAATAPRFAGSPSAPIGAAPGSAAR